MIEITKALIKFRRQLRPPVKDRSATGTVKYRYASLDAILREISPILCDCELAVTWTSRTEAGQICMSCLVLHSSGEHLEARADGPPDTSGKKHPIHQLGSSLTYLQRYSLGLALGIVTVDDDDARSAWGSGDDISEPLEADRSEMLPVAHATDETVNKALKFFDRYGISRQEILAHLGCKTEADVTGDVVEWLRDAARRINSVQDDLGRIAMAKKLMSSTG